ncbi:MAG: hypothetical protein MUC57_00010 [Desulfobacterales bacterium]|jgi:hypothetical protein|nr:hypothetical protein [Desulfobacterales bacterium]
MAPGGVNFCITGCGMSSCGAVDDVERCGCEFYFPAGPHDTGCMHHRTDLDGHCDNHAAQHAARNKGGDHGNP